MNGIKSNSKKFILELNAKLKFGFVYLCCPKNVLNTNGNEN